MEKQRKRTKIRQGVRQGFPLSPALFYSTQEALSKIRNLKEIGIKFGNEIIDMLRFWNDWQH